MSFQRELCKKCMHLVYRPRRIEDESEPMPEKTEIDSDLLGFDLSGKLCKINENMDELWASLEFLTTQSWFIANFRLT